MEANTNPVQSESPARKPWFGIFALVLSLVPIPLCVIFYILSSFSDGRPPMGTILHDLLGQDWYVVLANTIFVVLCAGAIMPFIGLILGGTGLVRKEGRRGFAIAGIGLGILTGLTMCILGVLNLLAVL